MLVNSKKGVSWQSSGQDSMLSLLRAQVQSLIRELGSCKPHGTAKKRREWLFFLLLVVRQGPETVLSSGLLQKPHLVAEAFICWCRTLQCCLSPLSCEHIQREGYEIRAVWNAEAPTLERGICSGESPRSVMDIVGTRNKLLLY